MSLSPTSSPKDHPRHGDNNKSAGVYQETYETPKRFREEPTINILSTTSR